ncbi:carbon-nitrogen hydrolase domain-containing protein [Trichoderma breve]|uniref:Carbon-nitrogen hydrolase domain-containing protein n=1 Tax=Trichoderma breve TaxID=2034170 RepID=A0A9W9EE82_9HYPO|nr:carbon-nitrogen hydrolase domain-containing protein [Trichoderma breve]KAJ4865106.1 carbon-nitrogen hydrolase domain-containing protein [Trichoderma breve]
MRIGCLQFAPQVGDVDNNLNRADAVLSKANPEDLDLLVLPELAFSGYNFKSLQDISPFLEPSGSGITALWARTMALKYNCTVLVGYPEKVDVSPKWPTGPEYYNSAIVVNGDGETIANYRKSFLYYTDESWALEGNRGFYDGYIPGLGNTSIGICMDINPYKFETPWHAFEFAFHVLEVESNLVIVSMAWMTREDRRHYSRMPNEPDMDTLTYWVTRLEPLIRSNNEDEIIVVFCNRTGVEDEATYTGTSAVIGIQEGEVNVYGLLGRGEKDLLVVDTTNPPYAKMVYRPDASASNKPVGALELPSHTNGQTPVYTKTQHVIEALDPSVIQQSPPTDTSISPQVLDTTKRKQPSPLQLIGEPQQKSSTKQTAKRRAPSISIPPPFESVDHNQTTNAADGNIPTPSAPSPTPMAVRPRLVIPQSPASTQNQQTSEDNLPSAISIRSAESIQSVKSNESEVSTQTIRSNPRPPEDSTPYPHSGLPLSGYPSNSFQNEFERRIYGGNVTISHGADSFSPTSPFAASTTSPRWFWRPHDSIIRTPVVGGEWTPSTPVGRKAEPFPWAAIKNTTPLTNITRETESINDGPVLQQTRSKYSQSPRSNTSSNRTGKSKSSTEAQKQRVKPPNGKNPSRPSSPKSRNASRSGIRGRSDSSLSPQNIPSAVSQHIEQISQRAESRNRQNMDYHQTGLAIGRPLSLNLANDGQHSTRADSAMDHMIPIVASPSLLGPGTRAYIPTPVAVSDDGSKPGGYGNNSIASHQAFTNNAKQKATPINREITKSARSVSRGRQPKRRAASTDAAKFDPQSERATSADSVINTILHSRVGKRHFDKDSQHPSDDVLSHTECQHQHPQSAPGESEFERVEVISCPSCPVHGRQSASTNGSSKRLSDPSGQRRHSIRDVTSDFQTNRIYDITEGQRGTKKTGLNHVLTQRAATTDVLIGANDHFSHPAANGQMGRSDAPFVKPTVNTLSPKSEPRSTKSKFNPTTPRAMMFLPADTYIDKLPNTELGDDEQLPTWFTIEKSAGKAEAGFKS